MERIRFFNIIFYSVIISRSLETDRKFTKVCSTRRKVKIVRVSSGIAMDLTKLPVKLPKKKSR